MFTKVLTIIAEKHKFVTSVINQDYKYIINNIVSKSFDNPTLESNENMQLV